MIVPVEERQRRLLSVDEWEAIDGSHGFWRLAEAGYFSVQRSGFERYQIVGHKYVGRGVVDGLEIQIREKVRGTLRSLVSAVSGAELRLEPEYSPAAEFDRIARHLLQEFTRQSGRYIAGRRKARYSYRDAAGPILAGSLDLPATMRLHASGRLGHFAYREGTLVRDEPLDRLVLAGLDELDRAAEVLDLEVSTVYEARWLAAALDEVRDQRFLATAKEGFLDLCAEVEQDHEALPADADLARLASVALLHRGFELEGFGEGQVPRAWFINLETLFEQAVRATLTELLEGGTVDLGHRYQRRMFTGGADTSRANPDLVVHKEDVVYAVGDVKYKNLSIGLGETADAEETIAERSKKEARSDLYQVLVHTASLEAAFAFLVYASDEHYSCRYLGESATKAQTWTVQVCPRRLSEDLRRFVDDAGLLPAIS